MNKLPSLIEALTIFAKYTDRSYPTHCEHDELYVIVSPDVVSSADAIRLDKLGFYPCEEDGCWKSHRFGSA